MIDEYNETITVSTNFQGKIIFNFFFYFTLYPDSTHIIEVEMVEIDPLQVTIF